MAVPLLRTLVPPKCLIADKAYNAQSLRDWLKSCRMIATIPPTTTRTVPCNHSRGAYQRRNRIERLFGHLKNWQGVAIRLPSLGPRLSGCRRARFLCNRMDLNESPTSRKTRALGKIYNVEAAARPTRPRYSSLSSSSRIN